MPFDPRRLLTLRSLDQRIDYSERDTMLYALGIGFGRDQARRGELPFVFEGHGLQTVPSFASAIAQSPFLRGCGWNENQLVPWSERLVLHRPLPPSGRIALDCGVTAVHDLGPQAGALVQVGMTGRHHGEEQPLFTIERGILARGDGGFGQQVGLLPEPAPIPARKPDLTCMLEVRPEQSLLYRLSGDLNPIHADPDLARRAGLPGPVMQNLCTLGMACRGVLETICEFDPLLIRSIEGRFTGGVYPGDQLELELWQHANVVSFRAQVPARGRTVLDHGRCQLHS